ncbi:unnamed protein product, partial [Rotaria sordida]
HSWYLIKSEYLILTWIMLGFHLELIGPTMPNLVANIKVTYSGMGSVLASRSAGYLFANLLGAILQNIVKKHSEGLLFFAFILPAIVVFAAPFVTSLILMCILFFIQGLCKNFTDLGGNNLLLTMWGDNAGTSLNSAHFGYGVGAGFVNLLIGRLIFAIVSLFLSVNICLSIIWFGAFCLAIAWLNYVWIIDLTSPSLYILGAVTDLIFSPIFPLSFGFFNQRLNVIPMLLDLLLCGTALGAITFNKIAGVIIDRNPNHFPTILAVCILMAIILYIASHIVYFFHQQKNLLNVRSSVINGSALSSEYCNEEEQQITNYLRDQEDK